MDTNEVVEMIDAITEGKNYTLEIEGDKGTGVAEITFTPSRFYIKLTEGWGTEHRNPRTAREIAGALVAWADRQDGSISRTPNSILGAIRWAEFKGEEVQRKFENLHKELKATPDIPENKDKLIALQQEIQMLREQGAKDFVEEAPENDV